MDSRIGPPAVASAAPRASRDSSAPGSLTERVQEVALPLLRSFQVQLLGLRVNMTLQDHKVREFDLLAAEGNDALNRAQTVATAAEFLIRHVGMKNPSLGVPRAEDSSETKMAFLQRVQIQDLGDQHFRLQIEPAAKGNPLFSWEFTTADLLHEGLHEDWVRSSTALSRLNVSHEGAPPPPATTSTHWIASQIFRGMHTETLKAAPLPAAEASLSWRESSPPIPTAAPPPARFPQHNDTKSSLPASEIQELPKPSVVDAPAGPPVMEEPVTTPPSRPDAEAEPGPFQPLSQETGAPGLPASVAAASLPVPEEVRQSARSLAEDLHTLREALELRKDTHGKRRITQPVLTVDQCLIRAEQLQGALRPYGGPLDAILLFDLHLILEELDRLQQMAPKAKRQTGHDAVALGAAIRSLLDLPILSSAREIYDGIADLRATKLESKFQSVVDDALLGIKNLPTRSSSLKDLLSLQGRLFQLGCLRRRALQLRDRSVALEIADARSGLNLFLIQALSPEPDLRAHLISATLLDLSTPDLQSLVGNLLKHPDPVLMATLLETWSHDPGNRTLRALPSLLAHAFESLIRPTGNVLTTQENQRMAITGLMAILRGAHRWASDRPDQNQRVQQLTSQLFIPALKKIKEDAVSWDQDDLFLAFRKAFQELEESEEDPTAIRAWIQSLFTKHGPRWLRQAALGALVPNRLTEASDPGVQDPEVQRIKALKVLGKVSGYGQEALAAAILSGNYNVVEAALMQLPNKKVQRTLQRAVQDVFQRDLQVRSTHLFELLEWATNHLSAGAAEDSVPHKMAVILDRMATRCYQELKDQDPDWLQILLQMTQSYANAKSSSIREQALEAHPPLNLEHGADVLLQDQPTKQQLDQLRTLARASQELFTSQENYLLNETVLHGISSLVLEKSEEEAEKGLFERIKAVHDPLIQTGTLFRDQLQEVKDAAVALLGKLPPSKPDPARPAEPIDLQGINRAYLDLVASLARAARSDAFLRQISSLTASSPLVAVITGELQAKTSTGTSLASASIQNYFNSRYTETAGAGVLLKDVPDEKRPSMQGLTLGALNLPAYQRSITTKNVLVEINKILNRLSAKDKDLVCGAGLKIVSSFLDQVSQPLTRSFCFFANPESTD